MHSVESPHVLVISRLHLFWTFQVALTNYNWIEDEFINEPPDLLQSCTHISINVIYEARLRRQFFPLPVGVLVYSLFGRDHGEIHAK